MLDFELEELNQGTDWREVLSAYLDAHQAAHAAAKNTEEGFDGWLPRIMAVEGLETEDLPRIHGKLIALGFLKFQLASRGTGVVYQISPAGRQALNNIVPDDNESGTDEYDEPQDEEVTSQEEEILRSEEPALESETEEESLQSEETALDEEQDSTSETPSLEEEEEASQIEELPETLENEQPSETEAEEVVAQLEEEIEEADKAA